MYIPIGKPYITEDTLKYAHKALDSGWISSMGEYKEIAIEKLKELTGTKYVILMNSGTAAVHMMAKALYILYPGIKNLIVPNNVYVAAWNGFLFDSKFKLIPIDSNVDTWNIDTTLIPVFNTDTTALLIVHNLSSVVNVPKLTRRFPEALILEDACEGFLGKYENNAVGSASLCSAISFYGNKTLSTGEGGALLTNNKDLYDLVYKLHNQGQSSVKYIHDILGYNYRMTNVQAALLCGQLEALPIIREEKRRIFKLYTELLSNNKNIQFQKNEENTEPSNWIVGVQIMNMKKSYYHLEKYFKEQGIEIRPMFHPMSKHPYLEALADIPREKISQMLTDNGCLLPTYPDLTNNEIEYIVLTLENYVKKYS